MGTQAGVLAVIVLSLASRVHAQWDSTFGANGPGGVNALAVYNGKLYAAGSFETTNGITVNSIVSWDGANWASVGGGVGFGANWGTIKDMEVFDGKLWVVGNFDTAGGVSAIDIATWDGVSWANVTANLIPTQTIESIGISLSTLYIGVAKLSDGFGRVYKRTGSTWSQVGLGFSNPPLELSQGITAAGTTLYAGGVASNEALTLVYGGVAQLNSRSSWVTMPRSAPYQPLPGIMTQAFVNYNGKFYVGGDASEDEQSIGTWHGPLEEWTGTAWQNVPGYTPDYIDGVYALEVDTSCTPVYLYAGGSGVNPDGFTDSHNIRKFDGVTWSSVGSGVVGGPVLDMVVYDNKLYVGGNFYLAGGNNAAGIARLVGCIAGATAPMEPAEFLVQYFDDLATGQLRSDLSGDGFVTSADIIAFLTEWWSRIATPQIAD